MQERIKVIEQRIQAACEACGRPRASVGLIAVSKTKPVEMIEEAYAAGLRCFGENRAQEIVAKKPLLPEDIRWHFIGNLQKNKTKYLLGQVELIHSVNGENLALEIERQAEKRDLIQDILVEVNIAGEASKQGAALSQARALIALCDELPRLNLRGLMAVAPLSENPEDSRPYFRQLRNLWEETKPLLSHSPAFDQLSMGMSGDFEVAIEEGATMIRVGSALFGAREQKLPNEKREMPVIK